MGNLLGDFVRGTPDSLRGKWPDAVLEGIMMHRHLDRFTDTHPAFKAARDLLAPERRRFAGIVVDVFFDHFLARSWDRHAGVPLPDFAGEMYALLSRRDSWLDPTLRTLVPRMQSEGWLESYGDLAGMETAMRRISRRSPRTLPIAEAHRDLEENYRAFADCFEVFFPQARTESERLQQAQLLPW